MLDWKKLHLYNPPSPTPPPLKTKKNNLIFPKYNDPVIGKIKRITEIDIVYWYEVISYDPTYKKLWRRQHNLDDFEDNEHVEDWNYVESNYFN